MVLGAHVVLHMTELDLLQKIIFLPRKWGEIWSKAGFFEFIGKFGRQFFPNLLYNKSLFYLLDSCTNHMFWKKSVSVIHDKMFSTNQMAEFLNQLYLMDKMIYNFIKIESC